MRWERNEIIHRCTPGEEIRDLYLLTYKTRQRGNRSSQLEPGLRRARYWLGVVALRGRSGEAPNPRHPGPSAEHSCSPKPPGSNLARSRQGAARSTG